MGDEERARLLEALRIEPVDASGSEARGCLERYFAELRARFEEGFDPGLSIAGDPALFTPPRGAFLVARIDGKAVACGGITLTEDGAAYLKRMWVDAEVRGIGLGRRVLAALERTSAEMGCRAVRLETNRSLSEAIRLYESSGYARVPAFNADPYAHHWFEKRLSPGAGDAGASDR